MFAGVGRDLCRTADGGRVPVHAASGPPYVDAQGHEAGDDAAQGQCDDLSVVLTEDCVFYEDCFFSLTLINYHLVLRHLFCLQQKRNPAKVL